jgi:hypothetical protein
LHEKGFACLKIPNGQVLGAINLSYSSRIIYTHPDIDVQRNAVITLDELYQRINPSKKEG